MDTKLLVAHLPFVADAVQLQIGPRDLMYWPSSNWHVGVSEGQFQASIGVGVYFKSSQAELIGPALRLALQDKGGAPLTSVPRSVGSTALPPQLEATLNDVAEVVQLGTLRRELHTEWLRRLTSDGCLPPPPLVAVPLDLKDRVELGDGGPVLSAEVGDGLLISANGHAWHLRANDGRAFEPSLKAALLAAIDELNAGEWIRIGAVVRKMGVMGRQVHELFAYLAAAGAIRRCDP